MGKLIRNLILVSFSCFIVFLEPSYSEIDTLIQGQKLSYGDELVSAYGIFTLGFFSETYYRNHRGRDKYYVGMWYGWSPAHRYSKKKGKPVWVANRNTPIFDQSGVLTVGGDDGNLKIFFPGKDPILFTSFQALSGNTSATLLDNGNFVLHELNSDGSIKRVLWQSFDYPTDTLLPGMKIGMNLKTGHSWSLTAWILSDSPALGSFTLGMDPNGTNQLTVWWAKEVYWTSGVWINETFSSAHELPSNGYYFRYVSNEYEKYFIYNVKDVTNPFPMIVMHMSGTLNDFEKPLIVCSDSIECGEPDSEYRYCQDSRLFSQRSVGCVGSEYPSCRKGPYIFNSYWGSGHYGKAFQFDKSENLSSLDCREKCLRNCSCVAYAPTNVDYDTGCQIWSKLTTTSSSQTEPDQHIYILESNEKNWILLLMVVVGGVGLMSLLGFVSILLWRKYNKVVTRLWKPRLILPIWRKCKRNAVRFIRSMNKTNVEQEMLLTELGINTKHNMHRYGKSEYELQFFNFETIASATDNFALTNKLGEGGFGPVYKGTFPDCQEVAIKRLSTNSRQGLLEFKNEVRVIAKLQHNNLVRLLGCCIDEEEKILVYEYMPNKSLDFFLFDVRYQCVLDWKKRFNIIEGIVQGLLYLHKYSRLKIIHRDIKASNILLDSEMSPKISDFGMAKIFGSDESKANTVRVVGTLGYMSPEYAIEGICSTKSDVFSFGVLLLEIVSGKKNNSFHQYDSSLNLIVYAWKLWKEGRSLELIDPVLQNANTNEILRCISVGLLCIQENPMDRPSMLEVASMIYNDANELPSPKQPAFYNRSLQGTRIDEELRQENLSLNEASITDMEARMHRLHPSTSNKLGCSDDARVRSIVE